MSHKNKHMTVKRSKSKWNGQLDGQAEYNTPTLDVTVKPKMSVVLPSGARLTVYPYLGDC